MSGIVKKFNVETLGNCPPEVAQHCAELENINTELLEALEKIVKCEMNRRNDLATLSKRPGSLYEFSDKRVQRALTAIAKARGE